MIIYFSGTGNSEYVANRIAAAIGDEVINLFDKIKNENYAQLSSEKPWIVVAPTYAWRLPRILNEFILSTPLSGCRDIYFVMTCGGKIANSAKYQKRLCEKKDLNFLGSYEIVMPENYIALFETPTKVESLKIIECAKASIDKAISLIKQKTFFPSQRITFKDRLQSGIVNTFFYPFFVHAKKFYTTEKCISCEKCVKNCVCENIKMKDGKPVWGKKCTHCMACICKCPTEAIEYGTHSANLPRYVFPNK